MTLFELAKLDLPDGAKIGQISQAEFLALPASKQRISNIVTQTAIRHAGHNIVGALIVAWREKGLIPPATTSAEEKPDKTPTLSLEKFNPT